MDFTKITREDFINENYNMGVCPLYEGLKNYPDLCENKRVIKPKICKECWTKAVKDIEFKDDLEAKETKTSKLKNVRILLKNCGDCSALILTKVNDINWNDSMLFVYGEKGDLQALVSIDNIAVVTIEFNNSMEELNYVF